MNKRTELANPVPPNIEEAAEILRIGIARNQGIYVSMKPDCWKDFGLWGILLVDIARHVAKANEGIAPTALILDQIKRAFDAEWAQPTDLPKEL